MKIKLLIILAFLPLINWGQTVMGHLDGDLWAVSFDLNNTWRTLIISDYLETNSHYSDYFSDSISIELDKRLSRFYKMPDGSKNYWQIFGPGGQNKVDSDWLFVMKVDKGSPGTLPANANIKSGDVLKWEIGNSVYYATNPPPHDYDSDAWILCSSTDGYDGLTRFIFASQLYMFGSAPNIQAPNMDRYQIQSANFENTFPNLNYSGLSFPRFSGNEFDSIGTLKGWINTSTAWIWFDINQLNRWSVDLIFREAANYYKHNTPTRSLEIRTNGGTNSAPTADNCNTYIIQLDSIFTAASQAFTYNINTDGQPPVLKYAPNLTLSDTIYILTNEDYTIYDDEIAAKPIFEAGINVDYECSLGSKSTFGYKFNEAVVDTGFYAMNAYAMAGCDTIDTVSTVIRLFEPLVNTLDTISVLMVGNSTTNNKPIVDSIRTTVTGKVVKLYGTRGSGLNLHEGNSGYRYIDYVTNFQVIRGNRNPFWDGSEFNFTNYRTDSINLATPLDYVYVNLGINTSVSPGVDSVYIADVWTGYVKTFVDSAIADGTGKIIIAMPTKCENTGDGWINSYGNRNEQDNYIKKIQQMQRILNETYSGGRYADNVYVSSQPIFLNRDDGYPKIDGIHTDGVHPNTVGYNELSSSLRSIFEFDIKYK